MNKRKSGRLLVLGVVAGLSACDTLKLIEPYDPVIDKGLMEFKETFSGFVNTMGEVGGTDAGKYTANIAKYNELDAKIETLMERAELSGAALGCKLPEKMVSGFQRLLAKSNDNEVDVPVPAIVDKGNSFGCTYQMLGYVKKQMPFVREIHKEADKCDVVDPKENEPKIVSCLRSASVKDIKAIVKQTVDAAWYVETAKKTLEENDSWL